MYNDKDYFQHIQILAWDILIDSKAIELPVKITPIATLYGLERNINYSKTRWENTMVISELILKTFGLNYNENASQKLSVRLLCPLCVLKDCFINNIEDLQKTCDVPYEIATQRFKRLKDMKIKNMFYTSNLEKRVRENFNDFILNYIKKESN